MKIHPGSRYGRLVWLLAGLGIMIGLVAGAQRWSATLPGAAGEVYRNNLQREYAPYAYVYTEVTGVAAFLDDQSGRYGRGAFSLPDSAALLPRAATPIPGVPDRRTPKPVAEP